MFASGTNQTMGQLIVNGTSPNNVDDVLSAVYTDVVPGAFYEVVIFSFANNKSKNYVINGTIRKNTLRVVIPISGRVDRVFGTKMVDSGSIPGGVKPKTLKIGIPSFSA